MTELDYSAFLYVGFDHLLLSDKIIIDVCRLKQVSMKWKKVAKKLQVDCKTFPKNSPDEVKLKRVFDAWKVNQKPPFTMTSLLNVLRSNEIDASSVACQFGECTVISCCKIFVVVMYWGSVSHKIKGMSALRIRVEPNRSSKNQTCPGRTLLRVSALDPGW